MSGISVNPRWALLAVAVSLLASANGLRAATFFDDLSATNGGSETVGDTRWLAQEFKTDGSTYTGLSATLLMSQASAGVAQLDLYSDAGITPGSFIATFVSPGTFSTSSLANATFTATGLSLAANTDYWLVLHAPTGSYNWGWTSDFTIMQGWADTSNSGSVWFGDNAFPLQCSVSSFVVPEPMSIVLLAGGCVPLLFRRRIVFRNK